MLHLQRRNGVLPAVLYLIFGVSSRVSSLKNEALPSGRASIWDEGEWSPFPPSVELRLLCVASPRMGATSSRLLTPSWAA